MKEIDQAFSRWVRDCDKASQGDIMNEPMFEKAFEDLRINMLLLGYKGKITKKQKEFLSMVYHAIFKSDNEEVIDNTIQLLKRTVKEGQLFKDMAKQFHVGYNRGNMRIVKE